MLRAATHSARTAHPMEGLYRAHYGFVWHVVRRFGVAGPLTDDAVQDTFITAYRRFDELAMPTAKAWLYGIARRVASNYRRADLRGERKRRAFAVATDASPASATPPEAIIVLERFLAALDPVDRELFVLSEIEGMTGPEAAAILALNPSTTYSRVQSLRRRFRASVVDRDPSALVHEAREQRPRATAHGWLGLVPRLGLEIATEPAARFGLAAFAKAAAVACGVTLALGTAGAIAGGTGLRAPREATAMDGRSEGRADRGVARSAPTPAALLPTIPELPTAAPHASALAPASSMPRPVGRPSAAGGEAHTAALRSLELDNAWLNEATTQLREGDASAALATTTRHARELPDSPLADARAALRIEALCALGKSAQARGEASVLLGARPSTPVRARIERSCAGGSVDSTASGQQAD